MAATSATLRNRLLCGTALTVLAALPAVAQDTSTEFVSLDPILVRDTDAEGNAADRATSVYVSDAELERSALGDLKDLFAGIASVSVGGAIPVAQKIFVNGVDMLNLAIQVDGVSQNNRNFHHISANAFDPGLMKFVRVDPGVAPADAGPRAMAGRVVMETVDAEDIIAEGETFGGMSRLGYSSNGRMAQGSLTLAGRSNGFEILGYAKRATGENYEDGEGRKMQGTAADMTARLLKLAYESNQGHRVELSAQDVKDSEIRNFQPNFGLSSRGTWVYDTARKNVSLRYENTNDSGLWDPSVTLGFSETGIDRPNDPWGQATYATSNTYSLVLQNQFHLSGSNSITAGVDVQNRKTSVEGGWLPAPTFEESENIGLFAQARLQPTDRLSISTGLRYDWQDFTGQDFGLTGAHSSSHSGASGNISVVYDVTDKLSLRAGYSNIFGGVDLEDNFLFWQAWDYSALTSSRSQNIIIGADWTSGDWTLGGEVFRSRFEDVRLVTGSTIGSNDFDSEGINLSATYDWATGFARFSASHSDVSYNGIAVDSFTYQDMAAPLGTVLALEVQQELPQYNILVGGNIDAALSYDGGVSGLKKLENYTVLNLFAEYTPPAFDNVTLRASVNNVFDTQYADRASLGNDYADTAAFESIKEPGRSIVLEAVARF